MKTSKAKDLICSLINSSGLGTITRLYNRASGSERNEMVLGSPFPGGEYQRVTVENILPEEVSAPTDVEYTYYAIVPFSAGDTPMKFHEGKVALTRDEVLEKLRHFYNYYKHTGWQITGVKVESKRVFEMDVPSEVFE